VRRGSLLESPRILPKQQRSAGSGDPLVAVPRGKANQ
jgi:hypothetical protein